VHGRDETLKLQVLRRQNISFGTLTAVAPVAAVLRKRVLIPSASPGPPHRHPFNPSALNYDCGSVTFAGASQKRFAMVAITRR
jgi:hypothetical protein